MPEPKSENPFAVLGLAPTQDLALVKRAYFAELAKHPPHADPEGFQRLRKAYEALQQPGALALAFASSPIDAAVELERWEARFGAKLAAAHQQARAQAEVAGRLERFLDGTARLTLAEAQAAFSD